MKPTPQEASLGSMPCAAYLSTLTAGKPGLPSPKWKRVHGIMADSVCTVVTDKHPLHELFLQDWNIQLLAPRLNDCSKRKQLQLMRISWLGHTRKADHVVGLQVRYSQRIYHQILSKAHIQAGM